MSSAHPGLLLKLALGLIVGLVFSFACVAAAQINGVPASVTSIGFGGRDNMTPGMPASVTSPGPNGFGNSGAHVNFCCFHSGFSSAPNPPLFQHHRDRGGFFPIAVPYYTPSYTPVIVVQQPIADVAAEDEDNGGPTIFDRRGSGRSARARNREPEAAPEPVEATAPAPQLPVADQPATLLIFKDGRRAEIRNYAIVGDVLYDFTAGRHKIAIADLDLSATAMENDERGIDFRVPATRAQ
jgi:hypothetical protein